MRLLYFAAGLLWLVLVGLLFALVAVAFDLSMTSTERVIGVALLCLLAAPAAWQLRTTHRQIREMSANWIMITATGIELQLSGRAREWKGLPDVPPSSLVWSELLSIVKERRRFAYPAVIPMGYPLDVYTLYSKKGGFSFTRECIPNATRIATDIATRLGSVL